MSVEEQAAINKFRVPKYRRFDANRSKDAWTSGRDVNSYWIQLKDSQSLLFMPRTQFGGPSESKVAFKGWRFLRMPRSSRRGDRSDNPTSLALSDSAPDSKEASTQGRFIREGGTPRGNSEARRSILPIRDNFLFEPLNPGINVRDRKHEQVVGLVIRWNAGFDLLFECGP
jgi:hypothetical protein